MRASSCWAVTQRAAIMGCFAPHVGMTSAASSSLCKGWRAERRRRDVRHASLNAIRRRHKREVGI